MRRLHLRALSAAAAVLTTIVALAGSGDDSAVTGPQTEKRFPALQVPAGFKATLFACDPLIEYPSVIAMGPRAGTLFVAVDYMTGLGHEIVRRDEVRLIEDTDGDGYADKKTVVAAGFNSIQGLAYHNDTLYVMHAPYLTSVRLSRKTGMSENRQELLTGLGLPPEKDQIRLHNANGVVVGHDGWLYLALGDRGCSVVRPEGDKLVLEGGGILRCRRDGRDLHVFATGLRNIYDVALDADLNVFVRDNENDGGNYKVRVCHSFFGADHGYPYLYHERPDEALPPLADVGLGSSAGGVCYLEPYFPAEYHGNLFFCEWGKAVVRCQPRRSAASFSPLQETPFAVGAAKDPYGFKPTDLVVDRDGSLFVSDWADGQRPRRGRGRIYQIRYAAQTDKKTTPQPGETVSLDQLIVRLDAPGHFARWQAQEAVERRGQEGLASVMQATKQNRLGTPGRLHAVWIAAKVEGPAANEKLLSIARTDPDLRVRAQAVRALADLVDPILVKDRLDAVAGDADIARRIAELAVGADPRVMLEVIIALGRLRWSEAPAWMRQNLKSLDPALGHAAQWTLRQARNWPDVLKILDEPTSRPLWAVARRAVAEQYAPPLVDGLVARLGQETDPARQQVLADLLIRVHQKPGPWVYWGFRPGARPANTVAWERTERIEQALDRALVTLSRTARTDLLGHMVRAKVPVRTASLASCLEKEQQPEAVAAILAALGDRPAGESVLHLQAAVRNRGYTAANRLVAVTHLLRGLEGKDDKLLLQTCDTVEDGPVLAELLRALGTRKTSSATKLLVSKLPSADGEVRAAALRTLADLGSPEAQPPIEKLLADGDPRVRSVAALAAGKLKLTSTTDRLLQLTRDAAPDVRRSALESLGRLRDARALPVAVAALDDRETALTALECLADLGGPEHVQAVTELARREPSVDKLTAVGKVLTGWLSGSKVTLDQRHDLERALAEIHGNSGIPLGWTIVGPLSATIADAEVTKLASGKGRLVLSAGMEARVRIAPKGQGQSWLAFCEVAVPDSLAVEVFTASSGLETVWLNDKVVFQRKTPGVIGPYPDRFDATLAKGSNRVLVRLIGGKGPAEFQLRFRRKSATPEQERLARAALSRAGNPAHGREIFLNAEKSLCIKCHRFGDKGEQVGPELTGLGSRFSKVYIIESILEPSRTLAPSFETTTLVLKNGKVVNGIKVAETDRAITVVDSQIQKHSIAKTDIDEMQKHRSSTMPDGLEKRLTEDEFVDLISFLVNLKEVRPR
jgi:putative membrane-bound dehydrogenase-like protein